MTTEGAQQSFVPAMPSTTWVVPEAIVTLGNRFLLWSGDTELWPGFSPYGKLTTAPPDLLERFLTLDLGQPRQVLTFAQQFGVFGRQYASPDVGTAECPEVYVHEWPDEWHDAFVRAGYQSVEIKAHMPERYEAVAAVPGYEFAGVQVHSVRKEELYLWSLWQEAASALLSIANRLHRPRLLGLNEDWLRLKPLIAGWDDGDRLAIEYETDERGWPQTVRFNWNPTGRSSHEEQHEYQRRMVTRLVNLWLAYAGAGMVFDWSVRGPSVTEGGGGLFGALGVQLMHAVARADRIFVCSGCGRPYLRTQRKPKPGQHNWCPACQPFERGRRIAEDYRRRKAPTPDSQ